MKRWSVFFVVIMLVSTMLSACVGSEELARLTAENVALREENALLSESNAMLSAEVTRLSEETGPLSVEVEPSSEEEKLNEPALSFGFVVTATASTVGGGAWKISGLVVSGNDYATEQEAREALVERLEESRSVCALGEYRNTFRSMERSGTAPSENCLQSIEDLGGVAVPRNGLASEEAFAALLPYEVSEMSADAFYDIYLGNGQFLGSLRPRTFISLASECWLETLSFYGFNEGDVVIFDKFDGETTLVRSEYLLWNTAGPDLADLCSNSLFEVARPEWISYRFGNDQHSISLSSPAGNEVSFEYHTGTPLCDVGWTTEWSEGTHRVVQILDGERVSWGYDVLPGALFHLSRGYDCNDEECFRAEEVFLSFDVAGNPRWYQTDAQPWSSVAIYATPDCDGEGPCMFPVTSSTGTSGYSPQGTQPYRALQLTGEYTIVGEMTPVLWFEE